MLSKIFFWFEKWKTYKTNWHTMYQSSNSKAIYDQKIGAFKIAILDCLKKSINLQHILSCKRGCKSQTNIEMCQCVQQGQTVFLISAVLLHIYRFSLGWDVANRRKWKCLDYAARKQTSTCPQASALIEKLIIEKHFFTNLSKVEIDGIY